MDVLDLEKDQELALQIMTLLIAICQEHKNLSQRVVTSGIVQQAAKLFGQGAFTIG